MVIPRVRLAAGPVARALGLLACPALPPGEALLLRPCGAIHTFGMQYSLDVIFLDARDRVVRVARNVGAGRIVWGGRGAHAALELAAGWLPPTAVAAGDQLTWGTESAAAQSPESPPRRS